MMKMNLNLRIRKVQESQAEVKGGEDANVDKIPGWNTYDGLCQSFS